MFHAHRGKDTFFCTKEENAPLQPAEVSVRMKEMLHSRGTSACSQRFSGLKVDLHSTDVNDWLSARSLKTVHGKTFFYG